MAARRAAFVEKIQDKFYPLCRGTMGQETPIIYPVLEDDTDYSIEVEVYDWPTNGGRCSGNYIENVDCVMTGFAIKTWLNLDMECQCEDVICAGDWECGAQRIVKIAAA